MNKAENIAQSEEESFITATLSVPAVENAKKKTFNWEDDITPSARVFSLYDYGYSVR